MASSKKGISAHQLHRMLGVTYKTAWFMAHRIREAMRDDGSSGPLGGEGKVVEADETYFGPKKKGVRGRKRQGTSGKAKVITLVERGGPARSFKVAHANADTARQILFTNASRKSHLMTDESGIYTGLGIHFAGHKKVMHGAGEYVKKDNRAVHSNTVENFFSVFKRGMRGVYQHCGEQHLHRYLAEFDFRYSTRAKLGITDNERATLALVGIGGKRLTYQQSASR